MNFAPAVQGKNIKDVILEKKGNSMKNKPINDLNHVYLYSKGWYKTGDLLEDLQTILGKRSGIEPKYITKDDIILLLGTECYLLIADSGNPAHFFLEFINDLRPESHWKFNAPKGEEITLRIIRKCLSVMSMATIDKINIGKADKNILPLKKHKKRKRHG